ncbi:MAG: DUF4868 domain-containing protein [Eubacteriaceae bacterium]|nr:DUF4868 domain-containing protein [Eubacteriaceae bacterium]
MDTNTLTEELRALMPDSYTWKFGLYSTSKSSDGLEMEWSLCNMKNTIEHIDAIREQLLKKSVAEKPVIAYSPFQSGKENIYALDRNDELIKGQLADVLLSIKNGHSYQPIDFSVGVVRKPVGYAFYGELANQDGNGSSGNVLFMRRGNPFLSGALLCVGQDDGIEESSAPLLKFPASVDFLLIGGICYIFSSAIERDFSFENRHLAIARKKLESIVTEELVGNYDSFEKEVMKSKNAKKFLNFDDDILKHISRLSIVDRIEFLAPYGVEIDRNGKMDTIDPMQCEYIIDLLCRRSCIDPLGRLSVGNNITRRE